MIIILATLFTPSVSCGAPSFSTGVTVEPVTNTTVDSEIVYQCQSGFLPEGEMTSVCRRDGMWNPDPVTLLCEGKMYALATRQANIDDIISSVHILDYCQTTTKNSNLMQQTVEFQGLLEMELL